MMPAQPVAHSWPPAGQLGGLKMSIELAAIGKWMVGKGGAWITRKGLNAYSAKFRSPLIVSAVDPGKLDSWTLALPTELSTSDLDKMREIDLPDVRAWLVVNKRAFDHGQTVLRLRLTSTSPEPLEVLAARAIIEQRDRNRLGALVHEPSAGASAVECLGFDLSLNPGQARYVVGDGEIEWTGRGFFQAVSVSLLPQEMAHVDVRARVHGESVRWRIQLDVRIRDRPALHTLTWPPLGEPPLQTSDVESASQRWIGGVGGLGRPPWVREIDISEWPG